MKIIDLVFVVGYFLALYLIAFFANIGYREEDDILFVSRRQWNGIFLYGYPS